MRSIRWAAPGALLLLSQAAAADVLVTFDPVNSNAFPGDTLVVYVSVDSDATDLRGFSLGIFFDPAVILAVDVVAGPLLLGASCPSAFFDLSTTVDSLEFDGAALGCSIVGPGLVAKLRFVAVAPGVSPLAWWRCILRDGQNAVIPHTCMDGTVTVDSIISVEPQTWARVKDRFRSPRLDDGP